MESSSRGAITLATETRGPTPSVCACGGSRRVLRQILSQRSLGSGSVVNFRFGEGFRTPAPYETVVQHLGPAFESLPRRKPRGGLGLVRRARPMEISGWRTKRSSGFGGWRLEEFAAAPHQPRPLPSSTNPPRESQDCYRFKVPSDCHELFQSIALLHMNPALDAGAPLR